MSFIKGLFICVNALLIITLTSGQEDEVESLECVYCICDGVSNTEDGCDLTFDCNEQGSPYCGPFRISWAYWADAGKLQTPNANPDSGDGYASCVEDLYCAANTVRQYMKNFATLLNEDCNGDGKVDCTDFMKMHMLGRYDCKEPDLRYPVVYERFDQCWTAVNSNHTQENIIQTDTKE